MGTGSSLINIGELSKPVTVLIEKISAAIGTLYQPHHVRRMATAEAEAAKIQALARIEVSSIEQRALIRMIQEEGKKQENMESITAKAIEDIEPDANPEELDSDWLVSFFDKCRLVSNQEMQSLWSRILAGQVNRPGSFSRRTIELVAALDKDDADMFTALCGFGWTIGSKFVPLIFAVEDSIYKQHGVNVDNLTHLESLGLLRFETFSSFQLQNLSTDKFSYYETQYYLTPGSNLAHTIMTGNVMLSKSGQELAPICGAKMIDEFPEYAVMKWKENGFEVGYLPPPLNIG
ncbi:MAG: DUF2806 domain-containing protein [Terracidiphilus sp.]|jgi:hypothetical protein